jgi:hypothetical protein
MPPPQLPANNPLLALLAGGGGASNVGQQQQLPPPQMPIGPPQGGPPQQGLPQQGPPQQPPVGLPPGIGGPQAGGPQVSGPTPLDIPNMGVRAGAGSMVSDQMARIGAQAPTPPINPVVDIQDNTPPIIKEAIRRRLFMQGM